MEIYPESSRSCVPVCLLLFCIFACPICGSEVESEPALKTFCTSANAYIHSACSVFGDDNPACTSAVDARNAKCQPELKDVGESDPQLLGKLALITPLGAKLTALPRVQPPDSTLSPLAIVHEEEAVEGMLQDADATASGVRPGFTELSPKGYCSDWRYPSTGTTSGGYDSKSSTAEECMNRCKAKIPGTNSFFLKGTQCGCSATKSGPCSIRSSAAYTSYEIITGSCPPTRYDGRCGPKFTNAACTSISARYCNEENGYCGSSDAHKNAQAGNSFDFCEGVHAPNCFDKEDVGSASVDKCGFTNNGVDNTSLEACEEACTRHSACQGIQYKPGNCDFITSHTCDFAASFTGSGSGWHIQARIGADSRSCFEDNVKLTAHEKTYLTQYQTRKLMKQASKDEIDLVTGKYDLKSLKSWTKHGDWGGGDVSPVYATARVETTSDTKGYCNVKRGYAAALHKGASVATVMVFVKVACTEDKQHFVARKRLIRAWSVHCGKDCSKCYRSFYPQQCGRVADKKWHPIAPQNVDPNDFSTV